VAVEPPRQRRDAHPVVDAQLDRLHPVAHRPIVRFPSNGVRVIGQAAQEGKGVIDVAALVRSPQRLILEPGGGDSNLLRSPVEIKAGRLFGPQHEAAHSSVSIVRAASVGIAAGRGAERKQRRAIAAIRPDRKSGVIDEA
jgi:hypothetical protein